MNKNSLTNQFCSGDPEAFITVMEKYNKMLWVIVGSVLNNIGTTEDIEECISDVYFSLWRNPKIYDPKKGDLKTFLAVIAKRKALDKYRQLKKINVVELNETAHSSMDDLSEYIIKRELFGELYEAIGLLKEPDKEIITRRYFFDEKPLDIANKMSLPVKEIENRLYQTKMKLRRLLRNKEVYEYES